MKKRSGFYHKKLTAIISTAALLAALTQPAPVLANEASEVTGTVEETTTVPEPVDGTADTSAEISVGEDTETAPAEEMADTGTEGTPTGPNPGTGEPLQREVLEPLTENAGHEMPESVTTQVYETTPVIQQTGNGKIVADYRPEDVFSVALPVLPEGFYNFTMDPQGLLSLRQESMEQQYGIYDGSSLYFDHHAVGGAFSGTSDIVDIVNRSNIPALLTVTLTVENRVDSPVTFTSMNAVDDGEDAPRVSFGIVPAASARLSEGSESPDYLYREQTIETDSTGYATATFYLPGSVEDYEGGISNSAGFAITGACSRNDSWADFIRMANENGENLKIHITYAVDRVTESHSMAIERGILNIDPATGMLVP